jgi:glycosyltransferase involved in cell wall biosynthesis
VQSQTYEPIELAVVEDGTDTDVRAWLGAEFPEATYIRHDENRGLAAARNTGLEWASGEFVAYLDDDDEWKPERIERQMDALRSLSSDRRAKVGVVYCGTEQRAPDGEVLSVSAPENGGDLRSSIQDIGASTLPSTFLFVREALLDVGGFDESLSSSIDHDIWMALATGGYSAVTVDESLVIDYKSGDPSMVTNTYSRVEGVRQYVRKWTPTYQQWYGEAEGIQYGKRYFTRVIARVVRAKVEAGRLIEAWHAARSILEFSDWSQYSVNYLKRTIRLAIYVLIEERFPQPVVAALRRMKRMIGG